MRDHYIIITLSLVTVIINSGSCLEHPIAAEDGKFFFESDKAISFDIEVTEKQVFYDSVTKYYPDDASKHVNFILFTRETMNNPENVDSRNLTVLRNLKHDKPIKITIHGWKGYINDEFSSSMRETFLRYEDVNLITVDWSGHESQSKLYPKARYQVPEVGRLVAEFVDFLVANQNVKLEQIHVIGHSLGAHVAGIAGQLLQSGKFSRVTGLDPASPEFYLKYPKTRLSTDSAYFVDVIHSAGNTIGFTQPIGHVDFFPNGGQAPQPGCGVDVDSSCSHGRSHEFYADSIAHPTSFPAISCKDYASFRLHDCNNTSIWYMGEEASKNAQGKKFLQTNREGPFGREMSGINYTPIVDAV